MKWGGAVVSVLLLVVWVGSGWRHMVWETPSKEWAAMGGGGLIGIGEGMRFSSRSGVGGWQAQDTAFAIRWWPDWDLSGPSWHVFVPLWMPATLALAATAGAWRLDMLARRRARVGLCKKCGYDRAGLAPGSVCPECGTATVAA